MKRSKTKKPVVSQQANEVISAKHETPLPRRTVTSPIKLRLVPTNLADHFTFEPPPKGFNLLRASMDELHSYGLPHRPDPKRMPQSSRLWYKVMKRIKKFVTPELVVRRDIFHRPAQGVRIPERSAKKLVNAPFSMQNWSGLVVTDEAPYTAVWGTWTVPAVQVPPGQSGDFYSSVWVGLGGYNGPVPGGNLDSGIAVLQAGTEQDASLGYNFIDGHSESYYAWFEWAPAPQVQLGKSSSQFPGALPDFPISPGQTVAVYVGALGDGSGRGHFSMVNLETGLAITPIVVPIPTVDANNNPLTLTGPPNLCAEWIVERPQILQNGQQVFSQLADFGEVNILNAFTLNRDFTGQEGDAKGERAAAVDDSNAIQVTMMADDGVTPLAEEIETPALHVTFQETAAGQ